MTRPVSWPMLSGRPAATAQFACNATYKDERSGGPHATAVKEIHSTQNRLKIKLPTLGTGFEQRDSNSIHHEDRLAKAKVVRPDQEYRSGMRAGARFAAPKFSLIKERVATGQSTLRSARPERGAPRPFTSPGDVASGWAFY